jgi:hypothetical protein
MTHPDILSQPPTPPPGLRPEHNNTVNPALTPKRTARVVENDQYAAFTRRILRAYARRIAIGDIEALAHLTTLAGEVDTAIADAVTGLRGFGYSWAEIGLRLGITRQAAQQRWGNRIA